MSQLPSDFYRNKGMDFSGNGHYTGGMSNGGYDWHANAKVGVNVGQNTYVGPTYSGAGGGNNYGSGASHSFGG